MRIAVAALSLSLALSIAPAFAQNAAMPAEGAGATAQPQLPAVVSNPGSAAPTVTDPTKTMPATRAPTPPADPAFHEPDLKHKDSHPDSHLIKDAPLPGDHVLGDKKASLIMVEYASMSCPHCAHFSNEVFPEIKKKYIDTGKIRYILRQFPLNEAALKGAMLLDCVGEKDNDKYFTFAKVLFESQNKWAFDANFLSGLETIAAVGGLSKEQFAACTTNTDREMKILKEKKLATDEIKVSHTPYILIDGEALDSGPASSVEGVSKVIDAKLAPGKK